MIKNIKVISWKTVKGKRRMKNEKAPKDSLFKKWSIVQILTLLERV
jgi:hypothetical protein